ncbi:uncharacterized protein DMENIID0001_101410 [Sergentomyia squamirostris]
MDGVMFVICIPTEAEEKEILQRSQNDCVQATTPLRAPNFTASDQAKKRKSLQSSPEENGNSTENLLRAESESTVTIKTPKIDMPTLTEGFFSSNRRASIRCKSSQLRKSHNKNWGALNIPSDSPMAIVVKELLARARIENATWTEINNGRKIKVDFFLRVGEKCERVKQVLLEWGIGVREESLLTLTPCFFFNATSSVPTPDPDDSIDDETQKGGAWERFVSSMTARFNVAQLVEEVRYNAELRFDFVSLLVIASIVAGFGLVEDNPLFLAASMLISPLISPIIASTFGTVIKDRKLRRLGIINELIGILITTLVGFVFGLIICSVDDRYGVGEGLTHEMVSRCELHSLLVGVLIALPSGAAVAIGILGENVGSLAGVAISASLLPPAVNSGLMWALACLYKIYETDGKRYNSIIKTNYYSNHQSIEVAIMGSISMCVTITNVISIYVMGVIFLRIKEVAPIATQNFRQFWKHDVKIARDYNKTYQTEDATSLRQKLAEEIAGFEAQSDNRGQGVRAEIVRRLAQAPMPSIYHHQHTWSPLTAATHQLRPTVQEIETLLVNPEAHRQHRCFSHFYSPPRRSPLSSERFFRRRCSMPPAALAASSTTNPKATLISQFAQDTKLDSIAETTARIGDVGAQSDCSDPERKRLFIVVPVDKLE